MALYPGGPSFAPQGPILPAASGDAASATTAETPDELDTKVSKAVDRAKAAKAKANAPKAP
jgi:hypothetical protein